MKKVASELSIGRATQVRKIANLSKDDQLFMYQDGTVVIAPKHNANTPEDKKSRIVKTEKGTMKIIGGEITFVEDK